jgi:hypothetical protein
VGQDVMSGLPESCALRRVYPPETEWTTFHSSHRTVWPSNTLNDNLILDSQVPSAEDSFAKAQITKPRGEVGCLSKGGYSLRKVLDWDDNFYGEVQVCLGLFVF